MTFCDQIPHESIPLRYSRTRPLTSRRGEPRARVRLLAALPGDPVRSDARAECVRRLADGPRSEVDPARRVEVLGFAGLVLTLLGSTWIRLCCARACRAP